MRIAIVGAGAIGSYFGGLLAKAGNEVLFYTRGDHKKAIEEKGLTLIREGEEYHIDSIKIATKDDLKEIDLMLICVKTYSTQKVCQEIKDYISDETIILPIQNGVHNEKVIQKEIPQAKVYPGNAYIVARRPAPGVVSYKGGIDKLIFGDPKAENNLLADFEEVCKSAEINVECTSEIERLVWNKFCFITAFGGVTAMCRSCIGAVLENSTSRKIYEGVVRESIEVAKQLHAPIKDDLFDEVMKKSLLYLDESRYKSKSSMLVDMEENNPTEIEAINGFVVANAKTRVPYNEAVYAAVKLAEVK